MAVLPNDVLDFWTEAGPKKWWKKDDAFDEDIRQRFAETLEQAGAGTLDHWRDTAEGALALVIVLDQFSRNLRRNSGDAFANDSKCVALVHASIESGMDAEMPDHLHAFFYMPLMHSEDISDQRLCVAKMEEIDAQANIKHAIEHMEIIERFGRFPHRNTVLGRESSEEEIAFLEGGGFSG